MHIDLGVCFIVQVDTTQFIHSVIDSFLGCLQFRAVASNIAVVLGSWYILAQGSCGLYLELELLSQRMRCLFHIIQFSSVQFSPTRLFAATWTAARQASLSITCRGPALAESRGSLRMSSIGKEKKASQVLVECRIKTTLFFYVSAYVP